VRAGADAADIAKQEAELRAVLQRGLEAALTHNTTALSRHRRCAVYLCDAHVYSMYASVCVCM
jgi:hypothetical protein